MPDSSLCQRNPATAQSAVRACFSLTIAALAGLIGAVEALRDHAIEAGALEAIEPVAERSRGPASGA